MSLMSYKPQNSYYRKTKNSRDEQKRVFPNKDGFKYVIGFQDRFKFQVLNQFGDCGALLDLIL